MNWVENGLFYLNNVYCYVVDINCWQLVVKSCVKQCCYLLLSNFGFSTVLVDAQVVASPSLSSQQCFLDSGGRNVATECQRPYYVESTRSRQLPEVKLCRVPLVLGWVTAWEYGMLLAWNYFIFVNPIELKCFPRWVILHGLQCIILALVENGRNVFFTGYCLLDVLQPLCC